MADEKTNAQAASPAPAPGDAAQARADEQDKQSHALSEQTERLREEVAEQRHETELREAKEKAKEVIRNHVSIAAIILTTCLSFMGSVRGNRADAVANAKTKAEAARVQAAELWAYYQTKVAERTVLEVARDQAQVDLAHRNLSRDDPSAKLDVFKQTQYDERIREFDASTKQVFYRVQELEREEELQRVKIVEPAGAVLRYDLATKLITLALILLSVTILSNREWLFWCGVWLAVIGVLIGFDGYVAFF